METKVKEEEDTEGAPLAREDIKEEVTEEVGEGDSMFPQVKVKEERIEQKEGEGDLQLEEENRRLKRKVEELEEEVAVLRRRKVEVA